jgi:hypothetical protein
MHGGIPPFPYISLWHGASLSTDTIVGLPFLLGIATHSIRIQQHHNRCDVPLDLENSLCCNSFLDGSTM